MMENGVLSYPQFLIVEPIRILYPGRDKTTTDLLAHNNADGGKTVHR